MPVHFEKCPDLRGKITIYDSDLDVKAWLTAHGGELITRLSEESRRAIAAVILYAQATNNFDAREVARTIRPLIGLTERQAIANAKYRQKVFERTGSSKLADKAATRYASKQHRFRAATIAHTELAFAYNQGADMGVRRAIKLGLMSRCAMVWTTAGTNRVCQRCLALKGTVVGYTDEVGVQLPPLHPRCRCAIDYREVGDKPLTSPRGTGNVGGGLTGTNALNEIGFKPKNRTQWSDEIRLANSGGKGEGYKVNCQRCVIAHEVRMRGYDVVARPSWSGDPLAKVGNWLEVFTDDKEIYNCVGKTATELENFITAKMKEWGKGSRAFVWFQWDTDNVTNHVIVTHLNENNFVQYGDPQTGKISVVRYFKTIKPDTAVIMRVDNLEFTDKLKWYCVDRRQTE